MNYIPCATFSCAWSCCYLLLVDVLRQTDDQQFQMLFVAEVGSCRSIMPLTWTTPCATRPVASIVEERKKSWNSNVEIDSLKKRLYNNHTLWTQILWSGTPPKKRRNRPKPYQGWVFYLQDWTPLDSLNPFINFPQECSLDSESIVLQYLHEYLGSGKRTNPLSLGKMDRMNSWILTHGKWWYVAVYIWFSSQTWEW